MGSLDERLVELRRRGAADEAVALLRRELGLSVAEAKRYLREQTDRDGADAPVVRLDRDAPERRNPR
jgi:hypothetical protein